MPATDKVSGGKRTISETSNSDQVTEHGHDEHDASPPCKRQKTTKASTPILTPSPARYHHHEHSHHSHRNQQGKAPIVRCMSGHEMIKRKNDFVHQKLECEDCKNKIDDGAEFYHCPQRVSLSQSDGAEDANGAPYLICARCWNKETRKYTGIIPLGQRVRIQIEDDWKLGSVLKHWPDDDTYTIQLDGEKREHALAYDIYDEKWEVQLVHKHQLRPTPTRMLSRCGTELDIGGDGDSQQTPNPKLWAVPRCLSGCKMHTMDASQVYHEPEDLVDEDDGSAKRTKLDFDHDDEDEKTAGIYCNMCGAHVPSGKIFHCPNESHSDGYDLCLKCSRIRAKKPPALASYDLRGLATFMASERCKKVAILCGAGISRTAGIPDFRSSDGIYKMLKKDLTKNATKFGLTLQQRRRIEQDAQYVFSMAMFEENPAVLYHVLGADIFNKRCQPTPTHCFFRLLQDRGLLQYVFTQNVDGLERNIGIDPKRLYEVHGTFASASCSKCYEECPISSVRSHVQTGDIPIRCEQCKTGYIKPDCVLFGQDLPGRYYAAMERFTENKERIDLLIVMGTSLAVKPVSDLPDQVNANCIRAVFNLDLNEETSEIFRFGDQGDGSERDMFIKGQCDERVEELCKLLKWDQDLKRIHQESQHLTQKIIKSLK